MNVELNCSVCGTCLEIDNIEMPQLELVLEQWSLSHTHSKEDMAEYRKAEIEIHKRWSNADEDEED